MSHQERKLEWIDNLRVIATVSVILLHISASLALRYNTLPLFKWWVGNAVDGFTRYCVPVFVMISGSLLLGKEYSISSFLKKRFLRVFLPFLFWALAYCFFYWYVLPIKKQPHGSAIIQWTWELISNGISYHFWFIYMLLGLYVIIPLINPFIKKLSDKNLIIILIIWATSIFINSLFTIFLKKENIFSFYFCKLYGYLGYLILGYYLSTHDILEKKSLATGLLIWISGCVVTIFGTYYLSLGEKKFISILYDFLSFNVAISATGLFFFLKKFELENKALILLRNQICKYSFGIYLVHVMVLGFLFNAGIYWNMTNPLLSVPLIFVLCLSISILVIYILNKIPYGKYISG